MAARVSQAAPPAKGERGHVVSVSAGKRVTIKEIAAVSGTSIGTVDRALSDRPGINAETKARVLEVARHLGYHPNQAASALSRRRPLKITVIYNTSQGTFFEELDRGILQAARELGDFGVEVERLQSDRIDVGWQIQQLQNPRLRDSDAVLLNAAGQELEAAVNELSDQGVTVVTFNSDLPGSRRLFFVGNDARQSGALAAELLAKLLDGQGRVMVLGNDLDNPASLARFRGFAETCAAEYPELRQVSCRSCGGDPKLAEEILAEQVRQQAVSGVFASSFSATLGCCRYLHKLRARQLQPESEALPRLKIVGYDLSPDIQAALQQDLCQAVLYQDPFNQSYQALRRLAAWLIEKQLPDPDSILIETRILLRHNAARYLPGTETRAHWAQPDTNPGQTSQTD